MSDMRKRPGDTLVVRNIARSDNTVTTAVSAITIQDEPDLLAVFIPKDTPFKNNWVVPPEKRVASVDNVVPSAQRQYRDLSWWHDAIRLYLPNCAYSVWLNFDDNGAFTSWYGNLEAPFVRTEIGLDTRDFALDIVAYPDGRWEWKDEAEFKRRLEVGIDSEAHQARVRAAGWELIGRFVEGKRPFTPHWQKWRPPPKWKPRILPQNWTADFGSHHFFM